MVVVDDVLDDDDDDDVLDDELLVVVALVDDDDDDELVVVALVDDPFVLLDFKLELLEIAVELDAEELDDVLEGEATALTNSARSSPKEV